MIELRDTDSAGESRLATNRMVEPLARVSSNTDVPQQLLQAALGYYGHLGGEDVDRAVAEADAAEAAADTAWARKQQLLDS